MNNTVGFKTVQAFLLTIAMLGGFSNALSADIRDSNVGEQRSKITIQDHEIFCRKDVGGAGGIFEFLNNTDDKAQGICNISNAKLADNQAFAFYKISIGYSLGDDGDVGAVTYTTALPAALRNSEFEIRQGSRVVVNLPTASLSNPFTGDNQDDQWSMLGALAYLKDTEEFTWSFKFPAGESITAGSTSGTFPFVEVRLGGYQTLKRNL